jgi:hypothetical protein
MSFSYSGNPSSSDHDAVRFLVGDTDSSQPKVSDEEIGWLLTQWSDVYQAAAAVADHMAATAASWMSFNADGVGMTLDQMQNKYMQLADALRGQGRRANRVAPYAGGVDQGDHYANSNDTSVQPLNFAVGMHDDMDEGSTYGGFDLRDLKGDLPA